MPLWLPDAAKQTVFVLCLVRLQNSYESPGKSPGHPVNLVRDRRASRPDLEERRVGKSADQV